MPKDFAYAIPIEVKGGTPLAEIYLPSAVYEYTTRVDLGDIRVFNADDKLVPYSIVQENPNSQLKKLTIFPIHALKNRLNDLQLTVKNNHNGDAVFVEPVVMLNKTGPLRGYLLDTGKFKNKIITQLKILWNSEEYNWMMPIELLGSNDLQHWYPITDRALQISQMDYDNTTIFKNTINIRISPPKYLILHLKHQVKGFQLLNVHAVLVNESLPPLQKKHIRITKKNNEKLYYQIKGFYPIRTIDLFFAQSNQFFAATVFSRANRNNFWKNVNYAVFYNMKMDKYSIRNNSIAIPVTTDPYWYIQLVVPTKEEVAPDFVIGWYPAKLIFLTPKSGSYRLAFGSLKAKPANYHMTQLLQGLNKNITKQDISSVKSGKIFELAGPKALEKSLSFMGWAYHILWITLSLVALVAIFALFSKKKGANS